MNGPKLKVIQDETYGLSFNGSLYVPDTYVAIGSSEKTERLYSLIVQLMKDEVEKAIRTIQHRTDVLKYLEKFDEIY